MARSILDKITSSQTKRIEYRKGWEEGKRDGYENGFEDGYAEAKKKYRDKDFYDPLGEEE